jgi:hypothetical protein
MANLQMSVTRWGQLLERWSSAPESGEKRMMVHLLAAAIVEESRRETREFDERFKGGYFEPSSYFDRHLELLGIDPEFMREQIAAAQEASEFFAAFSGFTGDAEASGVALA